MCTYLTRLTCDDAKVVSGSHSPAYFARWQRYGGVGGRPATLRRPPAATCLPLPAWSRRDDLLGHVGHEVVHGVFHMFNQLHSLKMRLWNHLLLFKGSACIRVWSVEKNCLYIIMNCRKKTCIVWTINHISEHQIVVLKPYSATSSFWKRLYLGIL